MFVCTISQRGAPSLRVLQGWVARPPVRFDLLCGGMIKPLSVDISDSPPSQRGRGRTTHFSGDARQIKSLGHAPGVEDKPAIAGLKRYATQSRVIIIPAT